MHEIQKERGLTAGFLSSDGKRFSSELATQTQKTDAAQKNFLKVLQGAARINPLFFKETFTPVETKLKELGGIREAVKAFKLTTLQAIATYNSCVNEMLHAVTEMNAYAESTCVSVSFTSIVQLLHGKEIAGQERASLNAAFSAGKFSKQLYRDWLYRVSAQNTYLKSFADLGGDDAKDMLRAKMQNADDEVTRFRNIAYDNLERSTLDAKPEEWFEASTRRIDKLMPQARARKPPLTTTPKTEEHHYGLRIYNASGIRRQRRGPPHCCGPCHPHRRAPALRGEH
jgi:Nitrate and nitrite sensing.